ncbi:hypothetical protein YPPY01_2170, partial [Yersinia pestis PY-01]
MGGFHHDLPVAG